VSTKVSDLSASQLGLTPEEMARLAERTTSRAVTPLNTPTTNGVAIHDVGSATLGTALNDLVMVIEGL